MGIGSVALKVLKLIPKYAFSDGASKIGKARRATVASDTKSIWGKGNEFALKNAKKKIGVGWEALKNEASKTMNSNKSIWSSIKSFGKSLISKPKQGIRVAEKLAQRAGKTAGFWAKAGGALKGLGKVFKKLPVIGTIIAIGCEIPDIYDAFSRGGAWEGTKQVLKSTAKIAGFAAGTALGAVVGGPVGALVGGLAGDMLVNWIVGGSYSENNPKTEDGEQETDETEKTQTEGDAQDSEVSSDDSSPSGTSVGTTTDTTATTTAIPSVPYPTTTGMTNPFGAGLSVPNPVSIGFGAGAGLGNPFGTGFGMGNPFGMGYDSTQALVNSLLQPGENIFLKYPMGYVFQYTP